VKSFVYLDEYKMYSLSSQLMQGVTDYILKKDSHTETDSEQQAGKFTSGRVMGEIIESTSSNYEKKFLHDYAYSLFENKLEELSKLVSVGSTFTRKEVLECVSHNQILKIKGKAKFVDFVEMVKSMRSMGTISQSLGIVTSNTERTEAFENISKVSSSRKAEMQSAQNLLKELCDVKNYAAASHETFYQKHLADVLEFSFGDTLELAMSFPDFRVSADLNRENLRESVHATVKKYSRFTEVEFVLLGVVTQIGDLSPHPESEEITEDHTMREAINISTAALASLENSFRLRSKDEIIIDPIAVYVEL